SLANQLSDTVFPITIIKVQGNQLYINRGNDGGLKLGDQFIVYQPGEDLVDPQTGEHLGATETEVGKVKVSRINPKFTIVDIIDGTPSEIQEGYILRRPVVQPGANKKASAKKTSAR
ncbi:MAG: hypothetical protein LUC43_03625, partial [Burkholderiales bacterium]|nr:hypothetical protein [Burkholderiales bacterium]